MGLEVTVFLGYFRKGVAVVGYGVIGSPSDSGSDCLGSSPGTPAKEFFLERTRAPSSSGLGLWLLKPATRVRIPSGLLLFRNYIA